MSANLFLKMQKSLLILSTSVDVAYYPQALLILSTTPQFLYMHNACKTTRKINFDRFFLLTRNHSNYFLINLRKIHKNQKFTHIREFLIKSKITFAPEKIGVLNYAGKSS